MSGMEAAVASGILKIVCNKLGPLVIKEYSSIVGVQKDLQELQDIAEEINCWLEKSGDKAIGDASSFKWLKKLRDVASDVDDVVDEFQLKAEKHNANGDDGGTVSKYLLTKPKSFIFQCKAASKIKAIKKNFSAIVKERTDVSVITNSLLVGHHPVSHINKATADMPTLPIVDEAAVVGRDQDKNKIITKLVKANDDQQGIKIVSIIGLGGSGKTTLAKLVFNDVEIIMKHFEVRLWVHVSQEFYVIKLVEKLFEAITKQKSDQHALQHMSETISKKLTGKRFLLVLDDVWIEDRNQWEELQEKFMVYLKSGALGSKILLTTRSRNVAEVVESTEQFELPFLSLGDSCKLFQLSLGAVFNGLGSDFQEIGKDIIKKCGGVPLAIKVIGGVLRGMKRIEEWQAMRDSNLLDVEDKEQRVSRCLKMSYFHLSSHQKPCFTICSLFPKGLTIDKEQLVDLWIAHDMITAPDGVDYLERIGNEWFDSLVHMSFLQKLDVQSYGRVRCIMHDLVHDLARSMLGDEVSLIVPNESSTKRSRYFSLTEEPKNHLPKNAFEKARAIYIHDVAGDDFIIGKTWNNAKHLRSIIMKYCYTKSVPMAIVQIKNLRYLSISGLKCDTLPEAISDLWGLQALHITTSYYLLELPKSIGKLKRLRTLNFSGCGVLKNVPDTVSDCEMISSIDLCACWKITSLPNTIHRNKNMRMLRLCYAQIQRLPSAITELVNLECLDLEGCSSLVELPDGIVKLKKLEVLNLKGCNSLKSMPVGIGHLTRLQKLHLFVVGEGDNSSKISELGSISSIGGNLYINNIELVAGSDGAYNGCLKQKTNLEKLILRWGEITDEVDLGKEVTVLDGLEPPPGIKGLEIRGYPGGQPAWWMRKKSGAAVTNVGKKAGAAAQGPPQFTFLSTMTLSDLPNLKHLEGLVELPCLEELKLSRMPVLESLSGGPLPSLVMLELDMLPSLGEVQMVTGRALADGDPHLGGLQIGSCLSSLTIQGCPKLEVKPYLPLSLEILCLQGNSEQLLLWPGQGQRSSFSFGRLKKLHLCLMPAASVAGRSGCGWELLQYMPALESLVITSCFGLTQLPESLQGFPSLWRCGGSTDVANLGKDVAVLDGLEPPPSFKGPEIRGYPREQPAWCMRKKASATVQGPPQFTFLSTMTLSDLPNLKHLEGLLELPCLQELKLSRMTVLESLSGGPLPSLVKLELEMLPSLGEVQMITGRALADGDPHLGALQIGSCLSSLTIQGCPKLEVKPYLPLSLEVLCLRGSSEQLLLWPGQGQQSFSFDHLKKLQLCLMPTASMTGRSGCGWELLQHMPALESLVITCCFGLTQLPESVRGFKSLQELEIMGCDDLCMLPPWLSELRSLQCINIGWCGSLISIPPSAQRLTNMAIVNGFDLLQPPERLGELSSLRTLQISAGRMSRLPESLGNLTSLQELGIHNSCPDLKRRCERGKGEDWHLISHIPNLIIS